MKKIMFLIVIVLLFTCLVFSVDNDIPFENLTRPAILIVKYEKIYILEDATVYIYTLKDFKLVKKFGRAGEGPREFKIQAGGGRPLSMSFNEDKLIVNSINKMSWFSNNGEFIKEGKVKVDFLLFPINDKFVGIGPILDGSRNQFIGFKLLDRKFDTVKVLFISDFNVGNPTKLILPVTTFTYNPVYKNKIYINSSSQEFVIDVFDLNGKKINTIKKDYKKLPISEQFKTDTLEFFRSDPRYKSMYDMVKKILRIRVNFPPIRDLQIVDDTIHVITYKRQGKLWECIMLDLTGKEIGKKFIPLEEYIPLSLYPILYSSYKGKLYSLYEDEEDEVWKIRITHLDD